MEKILGVGYFGSNGRFFRESEVDEQQAAENISRYTTYTYIKSEELSPCSENNFKEMSSSPSIKKRMTKWKNIIAEQLCVIDVEVKMLSKEYSEAIAETLDILDHTQKSDVDKISEKIMKFLKENTSKTYKPQLDYTKNIKDMNLKDKTIGILSIINKKYWCNAEERKVFEEKLKQNEIRYQQLLNEKYDTNKLFKDKEMNDDVSNKTSTDLTKYTEPKWHQKLLEKILRIFRKK